MDSFLHVDEPAPTEDPRKYQKISSLFPKWHADANCRGESDALFFGSSDPDTRPPYTLGDIKKAKKICSECTVRAECLTAALTMREEYGVWAGTTRKQRKELLDRIDAGEISITEVVEQWI